MGRSESKLEDRRDNKTREEGKCRIRLGKRKGEKRERRRGERRQKRKKDEEKTIEEKR